MCQQDETIYMAGVVHPDGESFTVVYTAEYKMRALEKLADWASHPEISFDYRDWNDMYEMVKEIEGGTA